METSSSSATRKALRRSPCRRFPLHGGRQADGRVGLEAGNEGHGDRHDDDHRHSGHVTEVREGEVLRASDMSMTVRTADGITRRFTQGELNKRGIEIIKDGKAVRIADLRRATSSRR